MRERHRIGFTLIELSIVLIIIGLIVGGILVGSDLILMARVKKTISQVGKFSQSVNAFQIKYGCLPGDCPNASAFGLGGFNGDGNGFILNSPVGGYGPVYSSEQIFALLHLSNANMLPVAQTYWGWGGTDFYSAYYDGIGQYLLSSDNAATPTLLISILAGSPPWSNPCPNNTNGFSGSYYCPGITALLASLIDTKIDDGLPNSGKVYEFGTITYPVYPGTLWAGTGGTNANVCQNNTIFPAAYNIANTNIKTCLLGFALR